MKDNLDELLDRALAAPPVPDGLELRITRFVQRSERKRKVAVLGSLGSMAALLLLLVHRPNQSPQQPMIQQSQLLVPARLYVASLAIGRPASSLVTPNVARGRKLDIFPAPSPLSKEEQVLLSLVHNHPVEAELSFKRMGEANDSPLHIEPLKIEPLPVGDK